jgi:hypothetical protein
VGCSHAGKKTLSDDQPAPHHDEERATQLRSFVVLAFIIAFVAALVWTVNAFRDSNRRIECLEAGHRDCVPLDTAARGRP